MAGSFRRRLLVIAAIAAAACLGAIFAMWYLAETTTEQRVERARDGVTEEVERLQGVLEATPRGDRPRRGRRSVELRSGFAEDASAFDKGPLIAEVVRAAAEAKGLVVLERTVGKTPILLAAVPVKGGGFAFAEVRVVTGRETRTLRAAVLILALLSLVLVLVSFLTVVRLTRELAARERFAALGRVAAGIAHEVRNPLAAMKLRADLARSGGEATPGIAKDLEDISSEITRLDRLVGDLLVVAGRRAGPRADVDLGELVSRRVSLLAPWAAEKGVLFACVGAARANVDADAVARAVDNMLRNAVEASPARTTVDVRVGPSEVTVVDRGPGVPKEHVAELFEPFFTTKPAGTGLGLALARAVATAHGGSLDYARDAECTRFTFTLGGAT